MSASHDQGGAAPRGIHPADDAITTTRTIMVAAVTRALAWT